MDSVSQYLDNQDMSCSFADLLNRNRESEQVEKQPKILKRWSDEEKIQLENLFVQGERVESIAEKLGRSLDAVSGQIKKLGLRRCKTLTLEQEQMLKREFWLLGIKGCAKKLNRSYSTIAYFAKLLELKKPYIDECDPPIPRRLLPYDMVKRVAILQRKSPTSRNKVEDAVVIFYDKTAPSTAMMAMHLDELCSALDRHFGRRNGVTAGALTNGWKRK
ncbi:gcrA cell cycle regulator family protein [Vibrio diazotrophicus]|uniref:gcrA cell cycle regulator family protein n=1 Tax=Vibrio diazotrophicus TaxID=685 RepID=UPI0022AFB567|nr:gcrA cell cycle regulator family protein [Vibrio diazotrophicus]MCZ4374132.1 gcrA cell cycle regulator family protein [Vibrio diazotrophicus]MCZ4374137.1 gcrA cell cycle regulator family protein [Vibrio diazotrophicus]